MKYDIIVSRRQSDLTAQVTAQIAQGWEPIGGIAIAYPATNFGDGMEETYAQAMIKRPPKRKWWKKGGS